MATTNYVRSQMLDSKPPPNQGSTVGQWIHRNFFASPGDIFLTLIGALIVWWAVPPLWGFLFANAVPPGGTVEQCRLESAGACWAYITARISFFIYGFYPIDQFWRPNVVFGLGAVLLIPLLVPPAPFKRLNAALFFVVFPIVSYFLLAGGVFGLPEVPTERWGGLLVTLIISLVGIICSIPLGIVLALGRQSKMPIIKTLCVAFIELVRAVPLITVLFMASIMLPLFVPQGVTVDKLLRALVAVTLFEAAYLAEVVRGGLQALPRGQYEAGQALGLSYWQRMAFIILPQALKHVIPGIVNNFISLFKDTTLVSIVGIFDLLNTVQAATSDINWRSPNQAITGYIFAAAIFWVFCFAMSRYSMYMERRLNTGHKR